MKALVVTYRPRADRLCRPLEAAGIEVVRAHPASRGLRGKLSWARDVARLGANSNVDVIFSHEPGPICLLLAMVGRRAGRPVLVRWRGDPWQEYDDLRRQGRANPLKVAWGRWVLGRSIHLSDVAVPVSRSLADSIHEHTGCGQQKLAPVPIAIDTELFRPVADRQALKRELGYPYRHVISLAMIFQYVQKIAGLDRFLPVLRAVVDAHDDVAVVIAGGGRLTDDFQHRNRELLDHPRIIMPGWVDDMHRLQQCTDIFCHFSYFDACPNVIVEAWSCGTPVVVNDYPALVENLEDGVTGYSLSDDASVEECLPAFERLLTDPEHRREMGERARQVAEEQFSYQAIGHRLLEVIRESLSNARQG